MIGINLGSNHRSSHVRESIAVVSIVNAFVRCNEEGGVRLREIKPSYALDACAVAWQVEGGIPFSLNIMWSSPLGQISMPFINSLFMGEGWIRLWSHHFPLSIYHPLLEWPLHLHVRSCSHWGLSWHGKIILLRKLQAKEIVLWSLNDSSHLVLTVACQLGGIA